MSKYMVLASLKTKDKKIGYRVFTNELKKTLVSLERECSDFGANVSVYKPLYGDMDENLPLPDITLYPSLIEFRDAIKNEHGRF